MDFILLYSNASRSSRALISSFPFLMDRAVSLDTNSARETVARALAVSAVPTLLLVDASEGKIYKRLVGEPAIRNWLLITLDSANDTVVPEQTEHSAADEPEEERTFINQDIIEPDLPYIPETNIARKDPATLKQIAEAMARDREEYEQSAAPRGPPVSAAQ